jgi:hypothetical protein
MSDIIEESRLFTNTDSDGEREQHWRNSDGQIHRLDGPAWVFIERGITRQLWFVKHREITSEVESWIEQIGIPPWEQWGDTEKTLFRTEFAGSGS